MCPGTSTSPETHALILAGPLSQSVMDRLERLHAGRQWIVLADAWQVARQVGQRPDIVLGHLAQIPTSVRLDWQQRGTRFVLLSSAYTYSELEFALNYAITTGVRDILLLGVVSRRLSESLSNLFLLARPEWGGARLMFLHGREWGYVLRHGESVTLHVAPHDRITLLPLSPAVTEITARGVTPVQRGTTLEFGTALTLTPVEQPVQIWIGAGRLLVIHEQDEA